MESLLRLTSGAPASALLLSLILAVSLIALYARPGWIEKNVLRPHGLVQRGDYGTLVTSGFIHADLTHLLFNAFTFWAFGFGLERQIGSPRLLVLYAAGLLGSSIATWLLHARQPGYSSLGASGAILAVLFASVVATPTSSIYILPIPVPIPAPLFALGYLGFSLIARRTGIGRVNHDAHIVGAVAGLVFMAIAYPGSIGRAMGTFFG
jgi:membrane associated rhomboid family serine protease